MEKQALALVDEGRLTAAQVILVSPAYAEQKRVFARGMAEFSASVVRLAEEHVVPVRDREVVLVGFLTISGFTLMWKLLDRSLARSESVFTEAERQFQELALYDALTELPSRRAFDLAIDQHIDRAHHSGERFALLTLDLDRFKAVNDIYGDSVGDALLWEIEGRLRAVAGTGTVARIGGDQFAVLSPFVGTEEVLRLAHGRQRGSARTDPDQRGQQCHSGGHQQRRRSLSGRCRGCRDLATARGSGAVRSQEGGPRPGSFLRAGIREPPGAGGARGGAVHGADRAADHALFPGAGLPRHPRHRRLRGAGAGTIRRAA